MIKYTLLLPISDRPHVFNDWKNSIENLNIDRGATQIILGDSTDYNDFGRKCALFLKSLNFIRVDIVSYEQKINQYPGRQYWKQYLKIGSLCAANYDHMSPHIKGDIVLVLEDDISVHPDTYQYLLQTLTSNEDIGLSSAISYEKNSGNKILAWGVNQQNTPIDNNQISNVQVTSVATGCFVTYKELLQNYKLEPAVFDEIASPDFCLCRYIRNIYNKKIILDRRVRTRHCYLINNEVHYSGSARCSGVFNNVDHVTPFKTSKIKIRQRNAPIFIISATGRAGSTWLQRIISSHDDIMIWGEPQGAIAEIYRHYINMMCIKWKGVVQTGNSEFNKKGYNGWIANVSPTLKITGRSYIRKLIINHFQNNLSKIWGFKVINWNPTDVSRLHYIFPNATFIFLHRNMIDVEKSFNQRKGWWPNTNFNDWRIRDEKLKIYEKKLPETMHYINIEYDYFKDNPVALCEYLENELCLSRNSLNRVTAKINKKSFRD